MPTEIHPLDNLETIVVDPEEIVELMYRNDRDEHESHRHQLVIKPPFEGEVAAETFINEDHVTYYPPDLDPKPYHFGPKAFLPVNNQHQTKSEHRFPNRHHEKQMFKKHNGYIDEESGETIELDDEGKELWEEWWESTVDQWEDRVRHAIVDEIVVSKRTESGFVETTVSVETQANDETRS